MNTPNRNTLIAVLATLTLAACAAADTRPDGAADVRAKLTQLQSEPQLAGRAPVAMKDAEAAVRAAEMPIDDDQRELGRYRVVMADRKVDIARAQAQTRFAEDERKTLSEQRETSRLDSRTREADSARDAAETARTEAVIARTDAALAREEAELARTDAARAQQQVTELEGKTTDRGLVVTLGDVLFASGGARLEDSAPGNLSKLAGFLNQYPDRTVTIEGHTDSVGSADSNRSLSLRRAESVKAYLIDQGVASARVNASGMGEDAPIADNKSSTGRQQNRRVEVIISNPPVASLRGN